MLSLFYVNWLGKGAVYRPAASYSPVNGINGESKLSSPLGDCESLPSELEKNICARIACLFKFCGPLAVTFAVTKIIIFTLNRMLGRWPRPHFAVENSKIIPFRTHRYSSTAIPWILNLFWVIAPLAHSFPYVILRNFFCESMSGMHGSRIFSANATAGFCSSLSQRISRNDCGVSAIASALNNFSGFATLKYIVWLIKQFQTSISSAFFHGYMMPQIKGGVK